MAIFFIILITIIATITVLIGFSTLKINIKELKIVQKNIVNFRLIISLELFNKIKWFRLKIDNQRMEKLKNSNKINIKQLEIKEWREVKKQLNKFKIENINLKAQIGTGDVIITAYTVALISALLAIVLARKAEKPQYIVEPVYVEKSYIYLSINCIISIKLVHIINIIKELKGKEVYKKHGRTSNRRTYANSNG